MITGGAITGSVLSTGEVNGNLNNTDATMPIATANTLGAIKVGSNLFIEKDGTLHATINGSPLIVTSVEEMTDTTRIYLNTTDWKLYYNDGSKWVASVDYLADYDMLSDDLRTLIIDKLDNGYNSLDVEFESGGIDSNTNLIANNKRIRTKNLLHLKKGTKIKVNSDEIEGFLALYKYNSSNINEFVRKSGVWFNTDTRDESHYVLEQDYDVRIILRKKDESVLEDTSIVI